MAKTDLQINNVFKKLGGVLAQAKNRQQMKSIAEFSINLIVKRTRLGYGVRENLGQRSPLRRLSAPYIKARRGFGGLAESTTPGKSNLTRTGQLLSSMQIISTRPGLTVIGPRGLRRDGKRNEKIAEYQADQGRMFNKLSLNEYNQILRYYRKTFGDLLRKRRLLR